MRDRAYRRQQEQKLYNKWAKIADQWEIDDEHVRYPEGKHGWIRRTAGNMPTCSNPFCCGNPRKLGYKTKQEIRAEDSEKNQLDTCDADLDTDWDYVWSEEYQDYI
jgi:hypothetical protein